MARKPTVEAPTETLSETLPATNPPPAKSAIAGLITDGSELTRRIKRFGSAYISLGSEAHTLLVSALYQVAVHGNVIPLNRFFNPLRTNDAQTMKFFVRRYSAVVGLLVTQQGDELDGLPQAVIQHAVDLGAIVKHNNQDGWFVVQNINSDAAKQWKELIEARLAQPDGVKDKEVFTRNNFAEQRILGDAQALRNLIRAAKSASGKSNDRTVIAVSDPVKSYMAKIAEEADVYLKKITLADG